LAGLFITLEGIDGAGKSTHLDWIAQWWRSQGREVVLTREPGGTAVGEKLRAIVLAEPMSADTEALLMFAARQEHLAQVILPALARGAVVVSDRFTDASFAYQGGGRGLPADRLEALETWVQRGCQPDLTLLFDLPEDAAAGRIQGARDLDRFERESVDFHRRVRAAYLARASGSRGRIRVIDGSRGIDEIRNELDAILRERA
jgi:dTMP kinase